MDYSLTAFGLADGVSGRLFMKLRKAATHPNVSRPTTYELIAKADIRASDVSPHDLAELE